MDNATWWLHHLAPLGFFKPCRQREEQVAEPKTFFPQAVDRIVQNKNAALSLPASLKRLF